MDQIIIKMISDYNMIMENSEKYIAYLNSLFKSENGNLIVIELIQNGAIYIFQNLEIFSYVIRPYDETTERYNEFLVNSPIPLEQMVKPDEFPTGGEHVEIELNEEMGMKDELNRQMIDYLKSLSKDFEFQISEDQIIEITLYNYETMKIFTLHLYYRIMEYLAQLQAGQSE
jgi:hypothetical protein